ncbi:MAG TPA: TorF family putative porin, partial [Rhodanobacteraceae bacterium]|nr:TorF family putative porin [Rhodanobacteraceae bacterium]
MAGGIRADRRCRQRFMASRLRVGCTTAGLVAVDCRSAGHMAHDGDRSTRQHQRARAEARRGRAPRSQRIHSVRGAPFGPAARALVAATIAICSLVPVHARAGELSGTVSLTSQLVDRGLAITAATPALQGGIAWTTPSGWSLGLSGGIELRSPDHVAESVARVARAWVLSENWRMQADMVYYHYAGRLHANVYEPGVYWVYRDVLTVGLSGVYVASADEHGLHPAVDVNFRWPLAGRFSISGGFGVARYAVPYGYPDEHYHTGYYRYGEAGLL